MQSVATINYDYPAGFDKNSRGPKAQHSTLILAKEDLKDILKQRIMQGDESEQQRSDMIGSKDEMRMYNSVGVKNINLAKKNLRRMGLDPRKSIPVEQEKKPSTKN